MQMAALPNGCPNGYDRCRINKFEMREIQIAVFHGRFLKNKNKNKSLSGLFSGVGRGR
jgi:hypothetical protein